MRGFFGALFVFLLWTGASIYYLSLKDKNTVHIATVTQPLSKTGKVDNLPEPTTPQENPNARLSNSDTNIDVSNLDKPDETPVNDTEKDKIASQRSPEIIDAQILADEIKRTIAISDTIDIDRDEPKQSLDNTVAVIKGPTVSTETFYPQYDNTDLILDNRLVSYATELKALLKENPDKKVTIIGHTDNVGNGVDNFQIALRKARQVKWYLTSRRGIPRKKVTAISRGEEEPIENNDSKWGRSKNNRIEVIID